MPESVKVATIQDLKPGQGKLVQVEGKDIALFNVNGQFFAIDDVCTHAGGPLSEGTLEGTTVTCPWHGSKFDVRSGQVLGAPAQKGVASYTVKVEGQDILIEVSPA
ncbi:MAG: non-heme iron oxygenase ferredoxin subunit [Chloroflexi bacterium]|nr:non-heme iron oxygenase ferredoxin subunit [Chloroflexota bacterium]